MNESSFVIMTIWCPHPCSQCQNGTVCNKITWNKLVKNTSCKCRNHYFAWFILAKNKNKYNKEFSNHRHASSMQHNGYEYSIITNGKTQTAILCKTLQQKNTRVCLHRCKPKASRTNTDLWIVGKRVPVVDTSTTPVRQSPRTMHRRLSPRLANT